MKHLYLLGVVCIAILVNSCKKDVLSNTALNSASTNASLADAAANSKPVFIYGVDILAPKGVNDYDFEMNVAGQLGVAYLREGVKVPASDLAADLVPQLKSQYKILLNFTSPGRGKSLVPFRTDTKQYQQDLKNVLNTFTIMPVAAVIENEESNRFYYSGTALDYITQLKSAIPVMHNRGIKVANGGITQPGLCYLVYKDLLAQGKTDSAAKFQLDTAIPMDSPSVQNRGRFIDTLLTNYAAMPGLNFVNFHWKTKVHDTISLHQAINYLKKRTGKKVISNEIGQLDFDPTTVSAYAQTCTNQGFPYVIWYSPDSAAHKIGNPLQNANATLTPSGVEYQRYLAEKKGR